MVSRLRIPLLAFATVPLCLGLAILGTSANSFSSYKTQRLTNAWFLPAWPSHFDTRDLQSLIATASIITVLNAILIVALVLPILRPVSAILVLVSAALAAILSVFSIGYPFALNAHTADAQSAEKDTLRSWTCYWKNTSNLTDGNASPAGFNTLCTNTRFAQYTTIPLLVLQLALLVVAFWAYVSSRQTRNGGHVDLEKSGDALALTDVRHLGDKSAGFSTTTITAATDEDLRSAMAERGYGR